MSSVVGSNQVSRGPTASQEAEIREAASSSGYNAGIATQIIQNPAAAQAASTALEAPQVQSQGSNLVATPGGFTYEGRTFSSREELLSYVESEYPGESVTLSGNQLTISQGAVPGYGRGEFLAQYSAISQKQAVLDAQERVAAIPGSGRGDFLSYYSNPALSPAPSVANIPGYGRGQFLSYYSNPPPAQVQDIVGYGRGLFLANASENSILAYNQDEIARSAASENPGIFSTAPLPPPPPSESNFQAATSIGLKQNTPFPTLIGTQTGQQFAKGAAAPFVSPFTGQPDLAGSVLDYFLSGGKNSSQFQAFEKQGIAYDVGDILGNAVFAYTISQLAGVAGKGAQELGVPENIARATGSPIVFGGVSAGITAARGGSPEQIGEAFAISAGVGAGLEFAGFGLSKLVAYYAPNAEVAEAVAPTIGKGGGEVSVFETQPIENLGGKSVRIVADVTEQPASTGDLIAQYSGRTVPTAHATLNPSAFDLSTGGETLLESAGGAKGFRQSEQIFPFYSAPGSENSVTVYGGYSGIGEAGSETARTVSAGKPTALITEETYVSPITQETGETNASFEERYLSRSGETSVGLENLLGKSSERQLETTTAYERFGKQLPGSKFVSGGKVATVQVRQVPKLATEKLGIDIEADRPVISSIEKIFGTKYTKIDIFKGSFEPVTGEETARPLNLPSYSRSLEASEGAVYSKPVASVEFLYSLGPQSSLASSERKPLVSLSPLIASSGVRSSRISSEFSPSRSVSPGSLGSNEPSQFPSISSPVVNASPFSSGRSELPSFSPSVERSGYVGYSLPSNEFSAPIGFSSGTRFSLFGPSTQKQGEAPFLLGNVTFPKPSRRKGRRKYKELKNIFYTKQLYDFPKVRRALARNKIGGLNFG